MVGPRARLARPAGRQPALPGWAAAFPLTRLVARRRARTLFDLCAGFVYAQVLLACVRLRLFDVLREGPLAMPDLAARLALPLDGAARLLAAAAALQLVSRRGGGRFGLGALGAAMVGNPGVAAMVEHHALLYADLADPVALLRGDRPGHPFVALLALCGGRSAGGTRRRSRWRAIPI